MPCAFILCRSKSGARPEKRSSLFIMKVSFGDVGSLARIMRRPYGTSGSVSAPDMVSSLVWKYFSGLGLALALACSSEHVAVAGVYQYCHYES